MYRPNNKKKPSIKEQAIWNAASGFLCALETVIMEMVASHYLNLNNVGELTIAFALGNLFRTIGLWGTKTYHLSDLKYEFSFSDYQKNRLLNMTLMMLAVFAYVLYLIFARGTTIHKITVIVIIEIVFLIECYEDLVWGEYQRRGRLDIGAKLFIIRWGSILVSYSIIVYCFRSLIIALVGSLLISSSIFFAVLIFYYGIPKDFKMKDNGRNLFLTLEQKRLFKLTFPLFLISFLTFFLNNMAKYSLDYYYSEEIQAYFGFISLSMFVVEMLSAFVYQPTLTKISRLWIENEKKELLLEILRQISFILIILLVCLSAGWFLGIPVLSVLFSANLTQYKYDLMLNILAGGVMAFVMYACAVLTIMRKQKLQLFILGVIDTLGGIIIWNMVKRFGVRGCSVGNLMVYALQAIVMYIVMLCVFFKGEKVNKN